MTFAPADHLAVKAAARKRFMSFDKFVSEIAILAAQSVLVADDSGFGSKIIEDVLQAKPASKTAVSPPAA